MTSCQVCELFCSQPHITTSHSSPESHPVNRDVTPLYRLYMKQSLALKRTGACKTRAQHFVNTPPPDVFCSSIIELIVSMSIWMLSKKPTSRGDRALKSLLTILPMNTPMADVEMSPCSHASLSWGGNWVITGDISKKVGSGVHLDWRAEKCVRPLGAELVPFPLLSVVHVFHCWTLNSEICRMLSSHFCKSCPDRF